MAPRARRRAVDTPGRRRYARSLQSAAGFGRIALACFVAAIAAIAAVAGPGPPASTQEAPRTAWGAPDLQGVWDFRTITPLQRSERYGDREFLTWIEAAVLEQRAAYRDRRRWLAPAERTKAGGKVISFNNSWRDRGTRTIETRRTSLIVDPPNGRMPEMSAAGQARMAARHERQAEHPADSWLDHTVVDRCILGGNTGPPILPNGDHQYMQVFQTEDTVVILNENDRSRIIPVDGAPRTGIRSWTGRSRGRWEGDTLVVETDRFTETPLRGWSGNRTVVERLTRQDDDTLIYSFTVTDPDTWTRPWTAEIPMRRSEQPLYEYACHEGNYSLANILAGARAGERAEQ